MAASKMWVSLSPRKQQASPEENISVLIIAPFSPTPRLSFGRVSVGCVKSLKLVVRNPDDGDRQVTVSRMPKCAGLSIEPSTFTVFANEERIVSISWEPPETVNIREILRFFAEGNSLQVILLGEAYSTKKQTKKVKRWCPPSKLPLSVLQPSNATFNLPRTNRDDVTKRRPVSKKLSTKTFVVSATTSFDRLEELEVSGIQRLSETIRDMEDFACGTPERRETFLIRDKLPNIAAGANRNNELPCTSFALEVDHCKTFTVDTAPKTVLECVKENDEVEENFLDSLEENIDVL